MDRSARSVLGALALAGIAGIGGCGTQIDAPDLPQVKAERVLLTKEQQEKAMAELLAKKEVETTSALRQIEKGK